MTEAAFWWVNTVSVSSYQGAGGYGPTYTDPVAVACWVEDDTILVRDASGTEVVSSSRVYAALSDAGLFPPGSLVTVSGTERDATVISTARFDSGALNLGLDHIVVHLT